jgi:hypothetical protein
VLYGTPCVPGAGFAAQRARQEDVDEPLAMLKEPGAGMAWSPAGGRASFSAQKPPTATHNGMACRAIHADQGIGAEHLDMTSGVVPGDDRTMYAGGIAGIRVELQRLGQRGWQRGPLGREPIVDARLEGSSARRVVRHVQNGEETLLTCGLSQAILPSADVDHSSRMQGDNLLRSGRRLFTRKNVAQPGMAMLVAASRSGSALDAQASTSERGKQCHPDGWKACGSPRGPTAADGRRL